MDTNKSFTVNSKVYNVIKLLGHGKGGYSYLVKDTLNNQFTLKKIHHEPCSYYTFGNKIESEINDYNRLKTIRIDIPKLIDVDYKEEIIIKEYIDGYTVDYYVLNDLFNDKYLELMQSISKKCIQNKINIDYYPTNFIINNDRIYYIDYECNDFMEEWSFNTWGIKFYSKTEEFKKAFQK